MLPLFHVCLCLVGRSATCTFVTHGPLLPELRNVDRDGTVALVGAASNSNGQPLGAATWVPAAAKARWPQREAERQCLLAACRPGTADVLVGNLFSLDVLAVAERNGVPAIVVSPFWLTDPCPPGLLESVREELPELAAVLDAAAAREAAPADGALTWTLVRHWLWRTLLDDIGEWRERALGLDPVPFVDDACGASPRRAPTLVYALPRALLPAAHRAALEALVATEPAAVRVVGPLVAGPAAVVDSAAASKLPPPTVYVGFGSMEAVGFVAADIAAALLRTLVLAVATAAVQAGWSALRVLVHAPDAERHPVADAVQSADLAHGADLPLPITSEALVGPLPDLRVVLAQENAVLAIHHGGVGTVVAAARSAVAQLVVPIQFDQADWAASVAAAGAGAATPLLRDWQWAGATAAASTLGAVQRAARAALACVGTPSLHRLASAVEAEAQSAADAVAELVAAAAGQVT